ncbi:invasion associated locus B family protein [Methylobacterium persicinum]|uniref:Invasion protein IalB n=1 Tax=Methylobacterium persicinum TaxID=374426 RepID=A0ABU0HS57_9HYPH|nr:invasion associated locus B family protein [Methylobacterium persicinum]MDQ0445174.1 invasion protein IalB [Methylobacterium persicinum]GJE39086.1 hypothetical protein KHHGKMAE_3165 [Methylobacterium persicinum]
MSYLRSAIVGVIVFGSVGSAAATEALVKSPTPAVAAPASAPSVGADPAATTAAYGDWILRCEKTGEKSRLCEVAQTIQVKDQDKTLPVAQIAFGRLKPGEPLRVTVALPSNISLPSSAALALNDKDPRPIDLPWRRCLPGNCIADAQPAPDALRLYLTASEPARLSFIDAAGRVIGLPLSVRGLQQALDALNKS